MTLAHRLAYLGFIAPLMLSVACQAPAASKTSAAAPKSPTRNGTEKEVSFKGAGGLDLHGTLLIPDGSKLPGVLLLPGSGPTDRNGNQPPLIVTDLLKETAERLAKEGYATLRFDKRATSGYAAAWPKGDMKVLSKYFRWENFVDDAKAALAFLQAQPEVDPKRTAVAGHSEGSGLAIQIGHDLAGKSGAPAALILMGAPGRPLEPILKEQIGNSLKRAKSSPEMTKEYMAYVDQAIKDIVEKGSVPPNAPQGLGALFNPAAIDLMRSYITIDPCKSVVAYPGQVLIVQGEKDIQVSAERDTPPLLRALQSRGKGGSEAFIVPSASHNLKKVGDQNKEAGFTGPVAPEALDKIVSWLKKNL